VRLLNDKSLLHIIYVNFYVEKPTSEKLKLQGKYIQERKTSKISNTFWDLPGKIIPIKAPNSGSNIRIST